MLTCKIFYLFFRYKSHKDITNKILWRKIDAKRRT